MKTAVRLALAMLMCGALNLSAADDTSISQERIVYKTIGDTELKLHVYRPSESGKARPAIVFFFGGGWAGGDPKQFFPHCEHLAERGMVAISAEYRVKSRHGVMPHECLNDARDAVRYVRAHAEELGVDPNRIASGGGSAGGHLAAAVGVIEEDLVGGEVSAEPNAMILFNPAIVIAEVEGKNLTTLQRNEKLTQRFGGVEKMRALCPYRHVDGNEPLTLILQGLADTTTTYDCAKAFAEKMHDKGNRCLLVGYPGQSHGFFNKNRGDGKIYDATLDEMDRFLVSLGYLDPPGREAKNPSDEAGATRVGE